MFISFSVLLYVLFPFWALVKSHVHPSGILAQDSDGYVKEKFGPTYIVASYIKYIESAGGRVVPIRYPLLWHTLFSLL